MMSPCRRRRSSTSPRPRARSRAYVCHEPRRTRQRHPPPRRVAGGRGQCSRWWSWSWSGRRRRQQSAAHAQQDQPPPATRPPHAGRRRKYASHGSNELANHTDVVNQPGAQGSRSFSQRRPRHRGRRCVLAPISGRIAGLVRTSIRCPSFRKVGIEH